MALEVVRRMSEGASKLRPGADSRSLRKSRFDSTCMLAGLALEFADLARSIVLPMSNWEGREPSSDGRDDAGDLGMLKLDM